MGNTDSRLNYLYRDHVLQLSGDTVPLRDDNGEFRQFYKDFIAGGNCTMEMFNRLISPDELRYVCRSNPANISNLIQFVTLTIIEISETLVDDKKEEETGKVPLSPPSSITRLETELMDLLVCVRILTKVFPMHLSTGKENWFWESSNNIGNLLPGFLLSKALLKLSFVQGFTLPSFGKPGQVTHLLWTNGVNTQDASYDAQTARVDSNRLEIVNLLLALCSTDLYALPNNFLITLCYLAPEYDVICLVASIVNTVCRYCNHGEESSMPYQGVSYKQSQQQQLPQLRLSFVSSSLQLLNLMCLRDGSNDAQNLAQLIHSDFRPAVDSNIALSYLATLNREFDLRLLLTSFAKIFKLPINLAIDQESSLLSFPRKQSSSNVSSIDGGSIRANSTVNTAATSNITSPSSTISSPTPGATNNTSSRRSRDGDRNNNGTANINSSSNGNSSMTASLSLPPVSPLFLQSLIFLTVLVQNNKNFQNYVADKFGTKLIVFSIYYLQFYDNNTNSDVSWGLGSAIIPLCYNLALFFSSKKLVLSKMLETFTPNYYTNKLPNFFKLSSGNINNITYRDFAIIHLCNMAISDVKNNSQPKPWLFELIYNLLPIRANLRDEELVQLSSKKRPKNVGNGNLSYNAAMSLLHLLSKMSNKAYLTTYAYSPSGAPSGLYSCSPGYKLDCLALLLRVISIYIVLYFEESKNLTFAFCRHQKILFQIRDSIETVSKNLNESPQDLKIGDYFEHAFDIESLARSSSTSSGENIDENNIYSNQILVFSNKRMSQSSENIEPSDGETNDERDRNKFNPDENLELSKSASGTNVGKNLELWEYADLSTNPIMTDNVILNSMRPKWPIGITSKAKAKLRARSDLSASWAGANSLILLMRITRLLLKQFPGISTITTREYYQLLSEIAQFRNEFKSSIKPHLPIFISELTEAQQLKVDLSQKNSIYQSWIYMVCWTNIFSSHSGTYTVSQIPVNPKNTENKINDPNTHGGHSANGNGAVNSSGNSNTLSRVSSADTLPSLERFNSNGSMISRTNSNNSSLMGYLSSSRNNDTSFSSPLDITNHPSPAPKSNGSRGSSSGNNSGNSGTSFLRFAWNGFTKQDNNYAAIQEEASDPLSSPMGSAPSHPYTFVLDAGLLKPNIWTGTKVKLFNVKVEEKEEFSLLDMTSSFLKRFRFNSVTSSGSTDTLNSAGGNSNTYNINGNGKTNNISPRPYIPRDSTLMLPTPKK